MKPKRILVIYPSRDSTVSIFSVIKGLSEKGHRVSVLSLCDEGSLHSDLRSINISYTLYNPIKGNSIVYFIKNILFILNFLSKNKIDVVFSHLQITNFILSIVSVFSRARVVLFRHHSDYVYNGNNRTEKLFDRVINFLGKEFVAPSKAVYDQMVKVEGVNSDKVHLIDYGYDFNLFPRPDEKFKIEFRKQYPAKLSIIMLGRLIPLKRPDRLIQILPDLINNAGMDIRLHLVGDGPDRKLLTELVEKLELIQRVHFHGHVPNSMDYLGAADVLYHLSESEASNGVVKEAALIDLPVVVCRNVGDFDDYLSEQNAYLLDRYFSDEDLINLTSKIYNGIDMKLSQNLKLNVIDKFNIHKVLPFYDTFLK